MEHVMLALPGLIGHALSKGIKPFTLCACA